MLKSRWIHRKRWLIVCLLAVEVVVFLIGGVIGLRIVREQMASMIGEKVKLDNARYAQGLAGVIESLEIKDTAYGGEGWQRMQRAVQAVEMPADGFACIVNADNQVVCHPELDIDPDNNRGSSLLYADLGEHLARLDELAGEDERTRIGQSYFLADGVHYIATREVAGTGHRILVHQPATGLVSVSQALTAPLMLTFGIIGGMVLLLTASGSFLVARRYEHILEDINANLETQVADRTAKHTAARNALIFGLAKLADSRDPETGGHLERICAFSEVLARQLQQGGYKDGDTALSEAWIRDLRLAAALHDIGKVGVADSALRKAGKLTDEERAEINRHPMIAADTLMAIYQKMGDDPLIAASVQVALYHHERWDGQGYPFKLRGEGIPLSARIVAVADVYDALTSKRVYKDAMTHDQASAIICDGAGSHFDPGVVEAFKAVDDRFAQIRQQMDQAPNRHLQGLFA